MTTIQLDAYMLRILYARCDRTYLYGSWAMVNSAHLRYMAGLTRDEDLNP